MSNKHVDINQAREALSRLAKGDFRMRIPAQPDDDDMILSAALDELERLHEERDKLIEVLRWYIKIETFDVGKRARDILKEIGVTVE